MDSWIQEADYGDVDEGPREMSLYTLSTIYEAPSQNQGTTLPEPL